MINKYYYNLSLQLNKNKKQKYQHLFMTMYLFFFFFGRNVKKLFLHELEYIYECKGMQARLNVL